MHILGALTIVSLLLAACATPTTEAPKPTDAPKETAVPPTAVPPTEAPKPTTVPTKEKSPMEVVTAYLRSLEEPGTVNEATIHRPNGEKYGTLRYSIAKSGPLSRLQASPATYEKAFKAMMQMFAVAHIANGDAATVSRHPELQGKTTLKGYTVAMALADSDAFLQKSDYTTADLGWGETFGNKVTNINGGLPKDKPLHGLDIVEMGVNDFAGLKTLLDSGKIPYSAVYSDLLKTQWIVWHDGDTNIVRVAYFNDINNHIFASDYVDDRATLEQNSPQVIAHQPLNMLYWLFMPRDPGQFRIGSTIGVAITLKDTSASFTVKPDWVPPAPQK